MRAANELFTALTFAGVMALTCAGLLTSHQGSAAPSGFGKGFQSNNLQGWSDWLHKRASTFGADPWSSPSNFQGWSDWMAKRNFGAGNGMRFGSAAQMQKWNDWLAKRGLRAGIGSPFATQGQFQGWSDWLNKRSRGLDSDAIWSGNGFKLDGAGGQFPAFGSASGLQDWRASGSKRQDQGPDQE